MRTNHVFTTILLVVIIILVASNATNAQAIEPETGAGAGLDYDCNTGWNIPVQDWVWTCYVIMDTTLQSLAATWDVLEYAGNINSWDEDMLYTIDDWKIVYGQLIQIEADFWHDWDETCRNGGYAVKLYCMLVVLGSMVDWVVSEGEGVFGSFIEHFDSYTTIWGIDDDMAHVWQHTIVCTVKRDDPRYDSRCLGFTPISLGTV